MRHSLAHRFAFALLFAVAPLASACSDENPAGETAQPYISLEVTPAKTTIAVGRSVTLVVKQRRSDGSLDAVPDAAWSSSNEAVATVDPRTGVVTGKALGTARVTATWGPGRAESEVAVVP